MSSAASPPGSPTSTLGDRRVSGTSHRTHGTSNGPTRGDQRTPRLADLLLVDDDPADIALLQDPSKLHFIMKDGRFHKEAPDQP